MSTELVMPSNRLILYHPLFLLPSIFPNIRTCSNELVPCIRWPKYWNFSFITSPSKEYSGLISFRIDWFESILLNHKKRNLAICDNMEDLEGILLREISHTEKRQISYDLAHMQNIKNKQKHPSKWTNQTKTNMQVQTTERKGRPNGWNVLTVWWWMKCVMFKRKKREGTNKYQEWKRRPLYIPSG